jgi:hypothetical protein
MLRNVFEVLEKLKHKKPSHKLLHYMSLANFELGETRREKQARTVISPGRQDTHLGIGRIVLQ